MFSASHITYYHLCHRKLWMHHRGLRQEDNSAAVYEGKLIGKQAYARRASRWRELSLGPIKIDHFDPRQKLVREVKKSPKLEASHIAQVKYYLFYLEQAGVDSPRGIIEYPKHRKTTDVRLTEADRQEIRGWEAEIERIVQQPACPELVRKSYCRQCAYRDFCFI